MIYNVTHDLRIMWINKHIEHSKWYELTMAGRTDLS